MADLMREYFNNKVPLQPGDPGFVGPVRRTWQQAWNNLSKQMFKTMPAQLDRTRVNRNKFLKAVQ